jgi:guanidinopropionase
MFEGDTVSSSYHFGATMEKKWLNDKITYDEHYDPKLSPRFSEIATFMRAPYTHDLDGVDIAFAGVPWDGGVTVRPGARFGPREIRSQSTYLRMVHHVLRTSPFDLCTIVDAGDVRFAGYLDNAVAQVEIETFFARFATAGTVPLSAGGDHSMTYPILRAIAKTEPVGLVHVDAHTDTWGTVMGAEFNHASQIRSAIEDGLVDPLRVVQIGIRGPQNASGAWDYSSEQGIRVITMEEFEDLGVPGVIAEVHRVVGTQPTYLTFDVDGLDAIYVPGTGTPEVGGITSREAIRFLRGLNGIDFVGADLCEVAPPYDVSDVTSFLAANLMFDILCLLAEAVVRRRSGTSA